MNRRFIWTEEDSGLHVVRRVASPKQLGFVIHRVDGAWFGRVGHGALFAAPSEDDAKALVEHCIVSADEPPRPQASAVRAQNVAIGLHHSRQREFATEPAR